LRLQPHALLEGSDFIEVAPEQQSRRTTTATTRAAQQGGHEDLSALSNKELIAMVKSLNGKGYSGKNKAELIAIVTRLRMAAAPAGVANAVPLVEQEQLLEGGNVAAAEEDIEADEGNNDATGPVAELEEDSDNDENNDAAAYQDAESEESDDDSLGDYGDDDSDEDSDGDSDEGNKEGEEDHCDKRQRVDK
jgi:hypothetical protein